MTNNITVTWGDDNLDDSGECAWCGEDVADGHGHEIVTVRQGASTRTADELARCFIDDVSDLTGRPVPADVPNPDGWLEDADDSQYLSDEIQTWEGYLYAAGYAVSWDDGFVIARSDQIVAERKS